MATLKKQNEGSKSSTQAIIPYKTMFPDGTCHISGKRYSQTVEFYDTNYQLATFDEKGVKFTGAIFSITLTNQLSFRILMKIKSLTKMQ